MKILNAGNHISKWGEGPIWYQDKLYYVDINGCAVIVYEPATNTENIIPVTQRVGTVVMSENGNLIIAGDNGFSCLNPATGLTTPIIDPESELPNNRFNDGKCSPDGRFFAGTLSMIKQTGAAKLYRLDPDGSLHIAYEPVTNSNGIAWTADAKYCYYIDTPSKEIKRFDYDSQTGILSNKIVAFDTQSYDASPDGMTIDADGHLWIAFCHGGSVVQFDPHHGNELQSISIPCRETTACAFGGPNLEDLYITTGIPGQNPEPLAGRLFVVKGLGVKGVPANQFAGKTLFTTIH